MTKTMASAPRRTKPLIEIPVIIGSVNVTLDGIAMPVSMARSDLSFDQADEYLCGKILDCVLTIRPDGVNPGQGTFPGLDGDPSVRVEAKAKSFRVTRERIALTLRIDADKTIIDRSALLAMTKRNGLLSIDQATGLAE